VLVDTGPAVGARLVIGNLVDVADVELFELWIETGTSLTISDELDDTALLAGTWVAIEPGRPEVDVDETVLVVEVEDADT